MEDSDPIRLLEKRLGSDWSAIHRAEQQTITQRELLNKAFANRISADTSVVLFGSIARGEVTRGSDADWILLVDGQAIPEHEEQRRDVEEILDANGFGRPGRSGIFGCMVGSHTLVHEIGGQDDTNSNTTRRILLLLESYAVGNVDGAHSRVRRQIISRYIRDDNGLLYGSGPFRVPRFLLNDLTRYWRTITVDFVYKQRTSAGDKWALRNAKLRLSRKLVFTSGLLRCFFCHLDPAAGEARDDLKTDPAKLITHMESELAATPVQLLLDDSASREELTKLKTNQLASPAVWARVRDLGRTFQTGLTQLFSGEDKELRELMIEYGVF